MYFKLKNGKIVPVKAGFSRIRVWPWKTRVPVVTDPGHPRGLGSGTAGAAAHLFVKEGYAVALISRGSESLNALASSIKESGGQVRYRSCSEPSRSDLVQANTFPVPAYGPDEIAAAFSAIHEQYPSSEYAVEVANFNIGQTVGGPFLQLTAEDIRESNKINIDWKFENPTPELKLSPESIAATYLYLVNQDRAAWTWELDCQKQECGPSDQRRGLCARGQSCRFSNHIYRPKIAEFNSVPRKDFSYVLSQMPGTKVIVVECGIAGPVLGLPLKQKGHYHPAIYERFINVSAMYRQHVG
ncbi:hypothetical protein B0H16DRAFT_1459126 [Mycena metata]|uniref:NAD(P)-binding protein n=1 Tax=Mycena metata TaxID=1033252 RepID=A0AAD7J320_9AGAR|nr:hypothetical protein B0H16DRAFT_1459126 [Mycena metata]